MKRVLRILCFGLIWIYVLACPNEQLNSNNMNSTDNPFVGTWIQSIIETNNLYSYILVFTKDVLTAYEGKIDENCIDCKYAYTYTNNHLILSNMLINQDLVYLKYIINDEVLKFDIKLEGQFDTFTKL